MATLITKIQDGLFSFDVDGTTYAGSEFDVFVKGNDVVFQIDNSEFSENFNDVEYDDGVETIGFASAIECLIALKDAGFTGNFNGGGSAPTILIVNQDGTANPPTDNVGDIAWTYVEQGIYTGVLSGYFAGKTPILYPNQIAIVSTCNILDDDTIEIRTYNSQSSAEIDAGLNNAKLILY